MRRHELVELLERGIDVRLLVLGVRRERAINEAHDMRLARAGRVVGWHKLRRDGIQLTYLNRREHLPFFLLRCLRRERAGRAQVAPAGVANRRRLLEVGAQEMQRARRSGQGLCVMMLDIDHFKRINDTFGHPAGDAVIQAMSRVCTDTVRTVDTVGRMGGEEFAVVLPETECAGALELADRLRERLEQFAVLRSEGDPIHFTVSIGVAQCVAETPDFAALLGLADQGLYRAKHGGRNRVAVMPQGETQS